MAEFLIFVPLQEEMEYAYRHMEQIGGHCHRPYDKAHGTYAFRYTGELRESADVTFEVIGDMGNLRTAARLASSLGPLHDLHAIFLLGIAGALTDEVKLGDVVIGTAVKTYYPDKVRKIDAKKHVFADLSQPVEGASEGAFVLDARKRVLKDSFFRYRRDAINWPHSEKEATKYMRHLERGPLPLKGVTAETVDGLPEGSENASPTIRQCLVFSSEMVVDSQEYIDFLLFKDEVEEHDLYVYTDGREHKRRRWFDYKPSVVDMETFGFYAMLEALAGSTTATSSLAFSIRGVSDRADDKERLERTTGDNVRRVAVENAVAVSIDMMQRILRGDVGGRR